MTDPKPPSEREEQQEPEKWYQRTWYQILLFVGGIALFVLVAGWILDWYIEPKTSGQKKDLVQALGLITAGVAAAVGIYFTWRGQRLTRQAQEENQRNTLQQLEQSGHELDITRRGQITERFTRAIDQPGSESLEIRLGGIYSLERTAREDRDYHWPIMEVLTTYVRTRAPRKREEDQWTFPPEPDIQVILTVIGWRSVYHRDAEYGPIDLELPSIGWQLFVLGSSQGDSTTSLSLLDTHDTRLLTEPLTRYEAQVHRPPRREPLGSRSLGSGSLGSQPLERTTPRPGTLRSCNRRREYPAPRLLQASCPLARTLARAD